MKKKTIIFLTVLLLITAISASVVFAEGYSEKVESNSINSMFESMRDWLQEEKDNGNITNEEVKDWEDHFNVMEEFHKENGLNSHCGGVDSNGDQAEGQNFTPGFRSGMMEGSSWYGM